MPFPSSRFSRAIVLVLDSVGVGALPDAAAYGDEDSDTLGHIARRIPLDLPALRALGLGRVARLGGGPSEVEPVGAFGRMAEASAGKDSVTGHWELMGVVLDRPFPVFPDGFPAEVIAQFEARIGRSTIGNIAASGTAIISALGREHMRTGSPIVYTSADSVFQIAAHDAIVPIDELYRWCATAYELVGQGLGVGRVIARPFTGPPGGFVRTTNRRDFALPPPHETVLDRLREAKFPVAAIGKIEDLFAGRGISRAIHASGDDEVMDQVEQTMKDVRRGLIFANLVDSDTLYGHRNDVPGYAANLERIDARIGELLGCLHDEDLLIITADHGNDPTTPGSDHSREFVPLLVAGPGVLNGADLGTRRTFADVGQTLAGLFDVGVLRHGTSFLPDITASTGRGTAEPSLPV